MALVSIPLAAAAGGPYLSLDRFSPWLVSFAVGLFAALFAAPFLIRATLDTRLDVERAEERSMLWWGAIALAVFAAGALLALLGEVEAASLAGSLGVVVMAEAGLVLAVLLAYILLD